MQREFGQFWSPTSEFELTRKPLSFMAMRNLNFWLFSVFQAANTLATRPEFVLQGFNAPKNRHIVRNVGSFAKDPQDGARRLRTFSRTEGHSLSHLLPFVGVQC